VPTTRVGNGAFRRREGASARNRITACHRRTGALIGLR
jgi:hypothetical protein